MFTRREECKERTRALKDKLYRHAVPLTVTIAVICALTNEAFYRTVGRNDSAVKADQWEGGDLCGTSVLRF